MIMVTYSRDPGNLPAIAGRGRRTDIVLSALCAICLLLLMSGCSTRTDEVSPESVPTAEDGTAAGPSSSDGTDAPTRGDTSSAPDDTSGSGETTEEPSVEPQGNVPGVLVGAWNGGPGDSSDFWLYIDGDGQYQWVVDDSAFSSGVAQVDGNALYLLESAETGYVLTWQIDEFGILHIADQNGVDSTYVRG
jgi:hypothetical protein